MKEMSQEKEENDWWPDVAFGTYKLGGAPKDSKNSEEVEFAIAAALDVGYRAFDCAQFYANEDIVGDALIKATNKCMNNTKST